MILYKYYGYEAGLAALRSSRVAFRAPEYFNDPFELSSLSNIRGMDEMKEQALERLRDIKKNIVILSLTKTPFNSLMWAHYGQDHKGFVVGYDVEDDFFTDEKYNAITVKKGAVRYVSDKTPYEFSKRLKDDIQALYLHSQGMDFKDLLDGPFLGGLPLDDEQSVEIKQMINDIFLVKSSVWSYEEEIRVVKFPYNLFESSAETQLDPNCRFEDLKSITVAPKMAVSLIHGAILYEKKQNIKEVYLGYRNPLLDQSIETKNKSTDDQNIANKAEKENWEIFKIDLDSSSWNVVSSKIDSETLIISNRTTGLLNTAKMSGIEANVFIDKLKNKKISPDSRIEMTNFSEDINVKIDDNFLKADPLAFLNHIDN